MHPLRRLPDGAVPPVRVASGGMEHDAALATLRQNLDSSDTDVAHEVYHPDAVLEFPQSGERFEGVENFKHWRAMYPA